MVVEGISEEAAAECANTDFQSESVIETRRVGSAEKWREIILLNICAHTQFCCLVK